MRLGGCTPKLAECPYDRGMRDSDITQRVVGILTQTNEWHRKFSEDPDREDVESLGVVGQFVKELFRAEVDISGDASPQEAVNVAMDVLQPRILRVLAELSFAYAELASVHDSGRTDVSSDDVLRRIALRAQDE